MNKEILFFFSALGAFNGVFLSIYFAINANTKKFSNYFLSLLFLTLSIRIFKSVFFYFNPDLSNVFIQIGLSACILIGPFLYLYLQTQFKHQKTIWWTHTIPFLLLITVVGIFFPYVEHREIWSKWIVKGIYLQWVIYIVASFTYVYPIFNKIRKKENCSKIDMWMISIYLGVAFIWMAYTIAAYTSYIVGALSFTFILYLIILLLVYKKDKSSTFFQEKEKYKNKLLDAAIVEHVKQKVSILVEKEMYLNPNITLDEAAKELNVSKHILSQYLNEKLGKSFNKFINEYRVEKAKTLLQIKNAYTVEGLGYDSGFNSKSTFFTTFKKITGKTPAEYQKELQNKF